MPGSRILDRLRKERRLMWRSPQRRLALSAAILLLLCSLGFAGAALHQRRVAEAAPADGEIEMEVDAGGDWQPPPPPPPPPPPSPPPVKAVQADTDRVQPIGPPRNVNAAWYDVPDDSLAKRRAGREELTAAHNRLPIGTLVRVTHLSNGKSTLVRITDRGIRDKKIKLDVCREAAEELGIVSKGIARVKMEVVRGDTGASLPDSQNSAAQQ